MKNVLVTGGAGYIGSHACKALAAAGFNPIAYDNLSYGHRWAVQWGPFIEADILDPLALSNAFLEYSPVAVMHFAAFAYVGESVSDPEKYYSNNVIGGLNVLRAMKAHDCKNLVFSSTCATYGDTTTLPLDETCPQNPINPYGNSKLMLEMAINDYSRAYGFRGMMLRYFNAAGADAESSIGESHDPETHLIPLVLQTALGERKHIEVYGTDYETHDGTCIRDYIHVTDLADAHVKALQSLLAGGETQAINLGTGSGVSVNEIIESCQRVTGRKIPVKLSGRRAGDPPRLVACNKKAQQLLDWQPEHSDIDNIVKTAWQWHNKP